MNAAPFDVVLLLDMTVPRKCSGVSSRTAR
jgi:hypothetical protein